MRLRALWRKRGARLTSVEIWNDQETGDKVLAQTQGQGRLLLDFHVGDVELGITCTKKALISACLGGRTHFASNEGACELSRLGAVVQITAQKWRGESRQISIDKSTFEDALRSLVDVEISRPRLL